MDEITEALNQTPILVQEKLGEELDKNMRLMRLVRSIICKYGKGNQVRFNKEELGIFSKPFSEINVTEMVDDQTKELVITVIHRSAPRKN